MPTTRTRTIRQINPRFQRQTRPDPIHQRLEHDVIYMWPVKTMTSRRTLGGTEIVYQIVMFKDGFLYCDCAGWQFAKEPKTCKHCKSIENEAQQRFEEYKRGDLSNFQVIEVPVAVEANRDTLMEQLQKSVEALRPPPAPPSATPSNPNVMRRYGRVIEF